ncbi:MAG: hypothetical protein NTV89_18275 [Proteobacteria bacterium]|nr:hypothetical protein [Pseudomonadota bacterium]
MKKITGIVLGIIGSLFFFISLSQAYDLIATDPPYDCTATHTNCQQCHVSMTNLLDNFVYAGASAKTKWHGQHRAFAAAANGYSSCATCHTSTVLDCNGYALVQTSTCKTCHNLNPPTLPNPNLPGSYVTPAAVSLPCDWVDMHNLNKSWGATCATGSCHGNCSTVIELYSFTASAGNQKVILQWETASETDNVGFNIYRAVAENGEYVKINYSLIPANGSASQSAPYTFVDEKVQNRKTYFYKLEDLDLNGNSTMHGPVSATPRWIFGIFGK